MSTNPKGRGTTGLWATLGIILLPVLCCLPLLIGGGVLGAGLLGTAGAVLGSPWMILAAVGLIIGLLVWARRRRHTGNDRDDCDCCAAPGPAPTKTSIADVHEPQP
ncbi:MAG: hypothetical protein M3017_07950 [Actinomycetota bacterium]|nr:hypothetical protein [Actinomycetota bacterium]